MAVTADKVLVELEARFDRYNREVTATGAHFDRGMRGMEDRGRKFEQRMAASGAGAGLRFAKGLAGGLLSGIGVAGFVKLTTDAVKAFDAIGKAARTAGVGSDFFQAVEFGGLEEGVNGINDALVRFAAVAGEAATGNGLLVQKLKLLNPALLENIQLATSQEERIRLVADAVRSATGADEKAAIVKATFGNSMIGLVRVFEKGSDGLDDYLKRARELGLVIDRNLIARSEEMASKLGKYLAGVRSHSLHDRRNTGAHADRARRQSAAHEVSHRQKHHERAGAR